MGNQKVGGFTPGPCMAPGGVDPPAMGRRFFFFGACHPLPGWVKVIGGKKYLAEKPHRSFRFSRIHPSPTEPRVPPAHHDLP